MMASSKKNTDQQQVSNRILVGTHIQGDLKTDGDIRIDGTVKGNIRAEGKVVVGEHGKVEGEVECKNAAIAGKVVGTMRVTQMLSLSASAKIEGQVHTEKLSVEPGAELNGSVSMGAVVRTMDKKDDAQSSKSA